MAHIKLLSFLPLEHIKIRRNCINVVQILHTNNHHEKISLRQGRVYSAVFK